MRTSNEWAQAIQRKLVHTLTPGEFAGIELAVIEIQKDAALAMVAEVAEVQKARPPEVYAAPASPAIAAAAQPADLAPAADPDQPACQVCNGFCQDEHADADTAAVHAALTEVLAAHFGGNVKLRILISTLQNTPGMRAGGKALVAAADMSGALRELAHEVERNGLD